MAAPPLVQGCGCHIVAPHHCPCPHHQPIRWLSQHQPTQQPVVREGEWGGEQWRGIVAKRTIRTREEPRTWWGHMKLTRCLIVSPPSCGIDDETAWRPHAASLFPILPAALTTRRHGNHMLPHFSPFCNIKDKVAWKPYATSFLLLPTALKMRWRGVHMPPRFPSFLQHQRQGGVEPTCCLVSPLSCSVEGEVVWSPHATLFLLLPAMSGTRQHSVHILSRFLSFLRCQRWGSMKSICHLVSLPAASTLSLSYHTRKYCMYRQYSNILFL